MASITKNDVLSYLESASMLEVSELITDIEEKFGVTAAAPVAVAAAAAVRLGSADAAAAGGSRRGGRATATRALPSRAVR